VLSLTRVKGLTLVEAAKSMGRSHEATKKLYARALSRFTEAFDRTNDAARG
jgi:DNA-directed RNA polymerase specialized sigma24 family protein